MVLHPRQRRRAVYFNAYAGYHGLASVEKHSVQKRRGKRIAVSEAYYYDDTRCAHDVALVKLKEPFDNVRPFAHIDTPEHGSSSSLGVVGYPADKDNGDKRDLGPFMYEEFAQTSWDLRNPLKLLRYSISTFEGK